MSMKALGVHLKHLREEQGYSLRDVERETQVSNAYLWQIEDGNKAHLPPADVLKTLADFYGVEVTDLLSKAGYLDGGAAPGPTFAERLEEAFQTVLRDKRFAHGTHVRGQYDLQAKRFIVEMYEELSGKKLLDAQTTKKKGRKKVS